MWCETTLHFLSSWARGIYCTLIHLKAQNQVGIFRQNPIFGTETFFQRPLENFLWTLQTCSRYLKGPPNKVLCVSQKNHDRIMTVRHTVPIKNISKKPKKNWFYTTSLGTTVVNSTESDQLFLPCSKWKKHWLQHERFQPG